MQYICRFSDADLTVLIKIGNIILDAQVDYPFHSSLFVEAVFSHDLIRTSESITTFNAFTKAFDHITTTIGIAIHNLIPVAIAIAIHNIPEGLASSIPLYCATSDRRKSCLLSFAAGMTEPLGAVLAVLLLYPFLDDWLLAASSAMVAGIMVFISFDELIPIANRYGSEHLTNLGIIAGFLVMMAGLILMDAF